MYVKINNTLTKKNIIYASVWDKSEKFSGPNMWDPFFKWQGCFDVDF